MVLIATVWQVRSRSMLILTLCDLGGPTGGGSGYQWGIPKVLAQNPVLFVGDRNYLYLIR